jgi:hypothetical protein
MVMIEHSVIIRFFERFVNRLITRENFRSCWNRGEIDFQWNFHILRETRENTRKEMGNPFSERSPTLLLPTFNQKFH